MVDEEREEGIESVYDEEGTQDLLKDDEISPQEEAFMQGYNETKEENDDSDDEEYEKSFDESRRARPKKVAKPKK